MISANHKYTHQSFNIQEHYIPVGSGVRTLPLKTIIFWFSVET